MEQLRIGPSVIIDDTMNSFSVMPTHKYKVSTTKLQKEFFDITQTVSFINLLVNSISLICLYGELGAGKTFLVQKLLKQMGIKQPVTSPTFVIMNEYEIKAVFSDKVIRHIDAYRINAQQFLEIVSQDELTDKRFLYIIEWPEKIDEVLPIKNRADVYISEELSP